MHMQPKVFDPNVGPSVGVSSGEPNGVYHANKAVSHSKLWTFHQRPAHYEGLYITGEMDKPESPAMRFGSAFHSLVLEGKEAFDAEFAVAPELAFRSKSDKAHAVQVLNSFLLNPLPAASLDSLESAKKDEIESFFSELPGKTVLPLEDFELAEKLAEKVHGNQLATDLLSSGYPETVFRSQFSEKFGFAVQCRADWVNFDGCETSGGEPYMLDVKTIDDLSRWDAEFRKRGYYRAWPFYNKVMEAAVGEPVVKKCFWVVVEKNFPHAVRVYTPDETCWERGMAEIEADMLSLAHCLKHNDFSDPGKNSIMVQGLPEWLLRTEVTPGISASLSLEG